MICDEYQTADPSPYHSPTAACYEDWRWPGLAGADGRCLHRSAVVWIDGVRAGDTYPKQPVTAS